MKEIWKDIKGYEKYYKISSKGNVFSKRLDRIMLPNMINGYASIELFGDRKKSNRFYIHRLVAMTFISNLDKKPYINHKDANRSNNNIENLEWCTPSENIQHCFDLNRHPGNGLKGVQMHWAKLNELQVRIIKRLKNEVSGTVVARYFGVSHSIIYNIWNNKNWKHI